MALFGKKKEEPVLPVIEAEPAPVVSADPAGKQIPDDVMVNWKGQPRPMAYRNNGEKVSITRELIERIGSVDHVGRPNSPYNEPAEKIERWKRTLTLWEQGIVV